MAEGPRAGHQRARTFLSTRARPAPRRSPTGGTLRSLSVTPARRRGPLVPGKAARGAARWTRRGGGRAVCSVREGPREPGCTAEAPTCPERPEGAGAEGGMACQPPTRPAAQGAGVPRRRDPAASVVVPPSEEQQGLPGRGTGTEPRATGHAGRGARGPWAQAGPAAPTENGQGGGCSTRPGVPLSLLCPRPPKDAGTAPAIARRRAQVDRGAVLERRRGSVEKGGQRGHLGAGKAVQQGVALSRRRQATPGRRLGLHTGPARRRRAEPPRVSTLLASRPGCCGDRLGRDATNGCAARAPG